MKLKARYNFAAYPIADAQPITCDAGDVIDVPEDAAQRMLAHNLAQMVADDADAAAQSAAAEGAVKNKAKRTA